MKISSKSTRRGVWVGGALLGLVAIAVALALVPRAGNGSAKPGGDGKGKEKAVVPLEFTPSEVARPVLAKMPLVIEFSGPLVAPRTAVVRAKAPGTLLSLAVGEGSRVKAGQSIGEIDLSDLQTPGQRALGDGRVGPGRRCSRPSASTPPTSVWRRRTSSPRRRCRPRRPGSTPPAPSSSRPRRSSSSRASASRRRACWRRSRASSASATSFRARR